MTRFETEWETANREFKERKAINDRHIAALSAILDRPETTEQEQKALMRAISLLNEEIDRCARRVIEANARLEASDPAFDVDDQAP